MPDEQVKAYDRHGEKILVPTSKVAELQKLGGRVASDEEIAESAAQKEYDAQSTLQKVGTVATMAGPVGYAAHLALRADGAKLPPELEAYTQGVSGGFTGGLASVGMKEAVRAAGGDKAAQAYARTAQQTSKAYAGMHGAGEVAGLIGGAVAASAGGAARALPGAAISAAGEGAERLAAGGLAKVLGTGTLGRAGTAAGSMAVRGGLEGALIGGAQQVSEDLLGDHELAGEKILAAVGTGALYGSAGGAVLGGAGSLAGSAVRGTAGAARRGLARVLSKTRGAAEDVAAGARKLGSGIEDVAAAEARAAEVGGAKANPFTPDGATARAQEAANSMAVDALGARQTTLAKVAKGANKGVNKSKVQQIGEWLNRNVLRVGDDEASLFGVGMRGRADEMLPVIQQKKAEVGQRIGEVVRGHSHELDMGDILRLADDRHGAMLTSEALRPNASAMLGRFDESMEALAARNEIRGLVRDAKTNRIIGGKVDLSDMYQSRANMEGAAYELRSSGAAHDEFKGLMRDIDDHLVGKLDDAATGTADKTAREIIKELKHEYHMAASAERLAEDGAKRIAGNNTFGIREGIGAAAGFAMGSPLLGLATAMGGKVLRERGSAAGAYLLSRMAETGQVARMVAHVDGAIGKAAKGVVEPMKLGPHPYRTIGGGSVRARAGVVAKQVAHVQAEPEMLAERITQMTAPLANGHPNVAGHYQSAAIKGAALLASKVPVQADHDPLDPHPAARMTDAQASTLLETAAYVKDPMKFFEDAARGKITPEGVEVARELMPKAFAELQQRTVTQVADFQASGKPIPYVRRERLGLLLGVPLVPSQRPGHRAFLQGNLAPEQQSSKAPPRKSMPTRSDSSALDRLEGRNGKSH